MQPGSSGDDLTDSLANRVEWLIKHDYERLLNAVYLLDLDETKFNEAMKMTGEEVRSRAIAELILLREHEKFESRRRHRRMHSMDANATEIDETRLPPKESR